MKSKPISFRIPLELYDNIGVFLKFSEENYTDFIIDALIRHLLHLSTGKELQRIKKEAKLYREREKNRKQRRNLYTVTNALATIKTMIMTDLTINEKVNVKKIDMILKGFENEIKHLPAREKKVLKDDIEGLRRMKGKYLQNRIVKKQLENRK